jgi:Uma2 family endonuclease
MNIDLRRTMTVEDYLSWGDSQTERARAELISGQIVLMAPEQLKHVETKFAIALGLTMAVRRAGLDCHVLTDGATIRIDDHTAYEPDACVYCGDELPGEAMVVPNPVIVAEVLSPTSRHHDTSAKLIGYFKLASVAHYLIIDPDLRTVTHHARDRAAAALSTGVLRLDPPGIEIAVADRFGAT